MTKWMVGLLACAIAGCGGATNMSSISARVKSGLDDLHARDGGYKRLDDDPILAVHQRRFESERENIAQNHEAFFAIPSPSTCAIDPTLFEQLGLITVAREENPSYRAEDLTSGVQGGTCEEGKPRGDVTVVLAWKRTARAPGGLDVTTSATKTLKLVGTMGPDGFSGPMAIYLRESKIETRVGDHLMKSADSTMSALGLGDYHFRVSYVTLESYYPKEVHRERGVTFGIVANDATHVIEVIDPLPDGRRRVTNWSGSRKAWEASFKPNGKQHGWQRTFPFTVSGVNVAQKDTCHIDGEIVRTLDCP